MTPNTRMMAIVYQKYGPPRDLQYLEVDRPVPGDGEVLVEVRASSVVYGDVALIKGSPFVARLSSGLLKPKYPIPGIDVAGRVQAVGRDVRKFQPGDEVYGDLYESGFGAYAEYVCAPEDGLAFKPGNASFEESAAVPQAGLVALQALRDAGQIQPGQKVLINGASGGNGTFAVQIAKALGAVVTGVCSTRNVDMVRSIGADHVIDYTQEDFTQGEQRYDLIVDGVANRSASECVRALEPKGIYTSIPFSSSALLMGPFISMRGDKKASQFSHKASTADLDIMRDFIEAGKVVPVIDRTFPLESTADALEYYGEGHSRGKVIVVVGM